MITQSVTIRPAEEGDLDALVEIYNHYVLTTHITFDTHPFTAAQRRPWMEKYGPSGPHRLLVADRGGRVAGYATSGSFRPKPAYGTSVETTIYLAPEFVGGGIGRRLYAALLDVLRAEPGVHRAFAGIALPNDASISLHEGLGFECIGTFREVGFKFGRYWDVRWYERGLEP